MADYSVRGPVAIIEINNPPVNALSYKVRSSLLDGLRKAGADKSVTCVVIAGKNHVFSAGADIREFGTGNNMKPWITDVGDFLDSMTKPVVAAIEGVALGGGLEIALFCHYRLALKSARVGFPEVNIGVLPGAGGTQRLPRAAGLENSLQMITTGNHVSAERALDMGIIDKIVTGDIIEEGSKFALTKQGTNTAIVCLRNRPVSFNGDLEQLAEGAMKQVKSKYRGYQAPVNCVRAVLSSAQLPYEVGMEKEHELFRDLVTSGQAAAQRYAFFAERAISRWQLPSGGNWKTARALPVKTSAVIGAGTMGGGIALSLVTAGIPCVLVEQNQQFLDKGLELIQAQLIASVQLGKMTTEKAKQCLSLLRSSVKLDDLKNVDIVIEAVYEDLKLKQDIFRKLDSLCKPASILASNTSTLDINLLAKVTNRPDKVVGTHFFAPAYIMKLLENIYGNETSAETVATVMKLGKTIRKVPVLVGSCTGFVANRMLMPYAQEALFCVEEGALPQDVDQAVVNFGMPMGKFAVSDLSGLDIGYRIRQEAAKAAGVQLTTESRYFMGQRNCSLTERLVENGRLGKKVGKGWYRYESPSSRIPIVDPEVTLLIEDHCRKLGIERRTVGSNEILERMQLSMINEGFKILEERICEKPEEIDIIWIYGFGWPKYAGGPMYYASKIGLKTVYEKICHYHKLQPFSQHWVPSSLLAKLSQSELPLSQWGEAARGSKL